MNAIMQRRRTLEELVADAQAAFQRGSIASRSWGGWTPSLPAIDEALNLAEGLRRTLAELRANREAKPMAP